MEFEKAKNFILDKLERELSPGLYYHNINHTLDVYWCVLGYCKELNLIREDSILIQTAALFHDSGFIVQAEGHEQISCNYAKKYLPDYGFDEHQISLICGMIMSTKIPQKPETFLEEIIADADLDYLGRDDFFTISDNLYKELKSAGKVKTKDEWYKVQFDFFKSHAYHTEIAIASRNTKKQENFEYIKSKLTSN